MSKIAATPQRFYILASTEGPPETPLVLKQDDVFGVFDRFGDIDAAQHRANGVYYQGTRFLSRSQFRFAGARPLLLSSTVRRDNIVLAADLTNPDLHLLDYGLFLPRGSLHIYRAQLLWERALHQQIDIRNFSRETVDIRLELEFAADFADIFEVRGTLRQRSGRLEAPRMENGALVIGYHGLDGVRRRTSIRCPTHPEAVSEEGVLLDTELEPGTGHCFEVTLTFESDGEAVESPRYAACLELAGNRSNEESAQCSVWTSNERFNDWIQRSEADLHMLTTLTPEGLYPYAGIPWFATPFGRDGIWTALECLWMNPALARGVLKYLARTQARTYARDQDAEPGKIIHESREGEMAALGEIPFGRYYGSVDSTPLYLLLAAAYFRRTGDRQLLEEIWDSIERALHWVDREGDIDGDGFVEYHRKAKGGLVHQGWKDSVDPIFHSNGDLAEGPIALSEVQAYVYAAKLGLAGVAEALGSKHSAEKLREEAARLQVQFEESFWVPSLGTYAIALDGQKRRCDVRSSNPGHALYCGIASRERAQAVATGFLEERFYSGWGIRTIAEGEPRYNPMSYHNGSIWPHDNAIISAGMSRYGLTELSSQVLTGLAQAAASLELTRLPELFCGFRRRAGKIPTWYPTACSPQAWSAAAPHLLLQAAVGLSIDAHNPTLTLRNPVLPPLLETVYLRNLMIGTAVVDLRLFRSGSSVAVTIERRIGDLDIVVLR